MATPPTLVTDYVTAFDSVTSPKTVAATASTGDVFVLADVAENENAAFGTPTGGTSISWANPVAFNTAGRTEVNLYTSTISSGQSWTLSATQTDASEFWGFDALRFSGSAGIGASNSGDGSGAPTLSLTTTADNSAILLVIGDWSAVDGTGRTYTQVNGASPTEKVYYYNSARYTVYIALYADAGAAGAKTVGVNTAGALFTIAAIEIKGTVAAPTDVVYVGAGAFTSGTGALTVALPAGATTGDFLHLTCESANQTIATPTGWTLIDQVGTGTAAAIGAVRVATFWRWYAAGSVTVADSGDHTTARITAWRNVDPTTPIASYASRVDSSATTTFTSSSVTVPAHGMAVVGVGIDRDAATTDTELNAITGATVIGSNTVTSGVGGGVGILYTTTSGALTQSGGFDTSLAHAYQTVVLNFISTGTTYQLESDNVAIADGSSSVALSQPLTSTNPATANQTSSPFGRFTVAATNAAVADQTSNPFSRLGLVASSAAVSAVTSNPNALFEIGTTNPSVADQSSAPSGRFTLGSTSAAVSAVSSNIDLWVASVIYQLTTLSALTTDGSSAVNKIQPLSELTAAISAVASTLSARLGVVSATPIIGDGSSSLSSRLGLVTTNPAVSVVASSLILARNLATGSGIIADGSSSPSSRQGIATVNDIISAISSSITSRLTLSTITPVATDQSSALSGRFILVTTSAAITDGSSNITIYVVSSAAQLTTLISLLAGGSSGLTQIQPLSGLTPVLSTVVSSPSARLGLASLSPIIVDGVSSPTSRQGIVTVIPVISGSPSSIFSVEPLQSQSASITAFADTIAKLATLGTTFNSVAAQAAALTLVQKLATTNPAVVDGVSNLSMRATLQSAIASISGTSNLILLIRKLSTNTDAITASHDTIRVYLTSDVIQYWLNNAWASSNLQFWANGQWNNVE